MSPTRVLQTAIALFFVVAANARADLSPDQIRAAKRATAIVALPAAATQPDRRDGAAAAAAVAGRSFGSAFCIDASGTFVTNAHVVESAHGGTLNLVLNPNETDQKVVAAKILRSDKALDLALLQAVDAGTFVPLELGSAADLFETLSLTALGFPFGGRLALEKADYPSVSVNTGRITSLRKRKGELELIQLDAALNPGNSGGPVLDPNGRIVGIVQAGVVGSGVNFAIPVTRLHQLLQKPEVIFTPPALAFEKQGQEQEYSLKVLSFEKPRPAYTVQVTLTAGADKRTIEAKPIAAGGDTYTFKAVPVPPHPGPKSLQVTARYTAGSFTARVTDRALKIGDQSLKLSDVLRIERDAAKTTVSLASGKQLDRAPDGLTGVEATFGETSATLDLSKALSLTFESLDKPVDAVDYAISVKARGQSVADLSGRLDITGAPAPAVTVLSSGAMAKVGEAALEKDDVTRKLPGVVDDVIPAAGGRLLFLELKKLRKLAVFDVAQAKVTQFLPLPSDDVLCAAGAEKLLLIVRDQNLVQRWDLKTLQKELTTSLPEVGQLDDVAAGYASPGPVMLMTREGPKFLDFNTLKLVEIKGDESRFGNWRPHPQYPLEVRVSADGTTFAAWEPGLSPSGIRTLTLEGNTARSRYEHNSAGALLPSNDGSLLFTSTGIYSADLKPISAEQFRSTVCIPSYHPSYFLGVRFGEDNGARKPRPGSSSRSNAPTGPAASVSLYATGDKKLLITLPEFDELSRGDQFGRRGEALPLEKRIHFIPNANVILTVTDARDELRLRRFVVTDALDKAGIDYLFVASTPPRAAAKGQDYLYEPEIKSKRGGVKLALDSGPEGMTLDKSGNLHWHVPDNIKNDSVGVILSVKDASGQEIYHTFNIAVR
jgi:S1-C subfamily serine protease